MKPNKPFLIVMAALLIVGVVFIFSTQQSKPHNTITIGAIMALTGSNNHQALVQQKGLNLAIEEINRDADNKIRIVYEDHANDPKKAIAAYQNLKARYPELPLVITMFSSPSLAIAPLAEQDKIIQFILGTVSPKVSEAGEYVFRNSILPADEIQAIFSLIDRKYPKEKNNIAILSHQNPGGKEWALAFKKTLIERGGKVSFEEYLNDQNPEYDTTLLKLKNSRAEVVLLPLLFQQTAQVLKKSRELGITDKIFITYFSSDTPELLELAGEAAEGLIITSAFMTNHPRFQKFASAYSRKYGEKPEFYSALGYDSVYIIKNAFDRCLKSNESNCLKEEFMKIEYDGLTGKTTFDANGDTQKSVILKVVKNGKFITLDE